MHVLVTGAQGKVGRATVAALPDYVPVDEEHPTRPRYYGDKVEIK